MFGIQFRSKENCSHQTRFSGRLPTFTLAYLTQLIQASTSFLNVNHTHIIWNAIQKTTRKIAKPVVTNYGDIHGEERDILAGKANMIRRAVLRMLEHKQQLRKNNLNMAFESGPSVSPRKIRSREVD